MHPLLQVGRVLSVLARGSVAPLRWTASKITGAIWWLRQLRLDVWVADGQECSSGQPLSILCAVTEDQQNYPLKLIFGDSYRRRYLGRCWLWNVARLLPAAAPDCAMILAETFESHLNVAHTKDWFFIPTWVTGEVTLPRDAEATRKVDDVLRRIRRHGLRCEFTRDPEKYDDFYHNMYVPYISKTFGDCATIASHESIRKHFQVSDLLLIKNDEGSIAGQLIMHEDTGSALGVVGIRDGNRDYVKAGAGGALYHFGLQYLQDKGEKKVWLGWTRPFLRDGVLRFKKKWSQRLVHGTFNGFLLKILADTPVTRAFLCNNPFIFKREGRLFGAVFTDSDTPPSTEDIEKIDTDYFHPGMARVVVYQLRSRQPSDSVCAPASEHIELCRASDCSALNSVGVPKSLLHAKYRGSETFPNSQKSV